VTGGRPPLVLIVDDEPSHRQLYSETLVAQGFVTATAGDAEIALAAIRREQPALVVSDVRMPGADGLDLLRRARECCPALPFLLVTAFANVREAVAALRMGAVDYLAKPVDLDELAAAAADIVGMPVRDGSRELPAAALQGIVAESAAFRAVLADAYRVARSDATVLLTGESGSGKEVGAGVRHRHSPRRDGPLVAVNCAALPEGLLGSELFGHEKGAFTGALASRPGRFREADAGTLFLDEIGDMPADLQPALLRAIETGRITPVGGTGERQVDIRLVAATHRDLRQAVRDGRFREDLYYRLNVIALDLPPLRERPEDVLALARMFLQRAETPKRLSPAAARTLTRYAWPGNVRELANAIERARILSNTEVVLPEHLPPALRRADETANPPTAPAGPERAVAVRPLEEVERESIARALVATGGNRTHSAELLGISRRTLINKLKRYRLG
jgi:two-component system response regulator HydG